jgi:hypothetical protein
VPKKITKKFTATLTLNTEKGGAWLANVSLLTPAVDAGNPNSMQPAEAVSSEAAWKNASAGKRWIKEQVVAMTPRKSVKLVPSKVDAETDKPTAFVGVLEFKS